MEKYQKVIQKMINLTYQLRHQMKSLNYLINHIVYLILKMILKYLKKKEAVTDNPSKMIYVDKIENRITFKIKQDIILNF